MESYKIELIFNSSEAEKFLKTPPKTLATQKDESTIASMLFHYYEKIQDWDWQSSDENLKLYSEITQKFGDIMRRCERIKRRKEEKNNKKNTKKIRKLYETKYILYF